MSLPLGLTNIGNEIWFSGRPLMYLHLVHGMLSISRYLCTWWQRETFRWYPTDLLYTEFVLNKEVRKNNKLYKGGATDANV